LGELVGSGQDEQRSLFGRAFAKRILKRGPPGQSAYRLPASGRAGANLGFGIAAEKQGQLRRSRVRIRREGQDRKKQ